MEKESKNQQIIESYYNRGLFSEHYLSHWLPKRSIWQEDIQPVFSQTLSLYQQKKKALSTYNERQTEEEFIQPLVEILGFAYTPQVRFKRHEQVSIPDFALFTSKKSKHDAEDTRQSRDELYETAFFKHVAALTEAKYWERTLDTRASDNRDNLESRNRNPHFQITRYLSDSGVRWGILTNGTHWRLYFSGVESQEILYYEVELKHILEEENESDFRYFYHFFRAAAFEPDSEGRTFLDELFDQSRSYAKQIEERLKERIFDQVVPVLAHGFLADRRTDERVATSTVSLDRCTQETEESLEMIFDGTLLFLYRLIFFLYAEARNLLPMTERQGYFAYSLTKLKHTIFDEKKKGRMLSEVSTTWYDALNSLFAIIHQGDASINVPCYNGGLFAPDGLGDVSLKRAAEFLENHAIADSYLAEALMVLTRELDTTAELTIETIVLPDTGFIDYRELNVRHLGSIYEGLLEFKLKIAEQPLVKARKNGKDVYKELPNAQETQPDVQPGDIYLTNDKSERKATGSYYTPDYIVRYIVENTVGPLIDAVLKECQLAQEIRNESRSWNGIFEDVIDGKSVKEQKNQRKVWEMARDDDERRRILLNMLDGSQPWHDYDAPTRILELKILDPAIGSGHFLVGAMDFITWKMVELLEQFPNSPLLKEIEETRQKILVEAERQDVRIDAKLLEDENLLRRMVMKRCLYGVDLNPMAVELAKLSLWLHGFTVGAPLSFLDHHIKCGNSLIGATDVKQSIIKPTKKYQDFLRAVNNYFMVANLTDVTYSEVEQSYKLHEEAKSWLEPTKERLNVSIASHFTELSAQEVANAQKWAYVEKDKREAKDEHDKSSLKNSHKAQQIAAEKRFFHWPLEFPDAFFERQEGSLNRDTASITEREDPGFDAVIGNPPYGSEFDKFDRSYIASMYPYSASNKNSAMVFIEQGISLTAKDGFLGYIVPKSLAFSQKWTSGRELILKNAGIISDLSQAFEEVLLEQMIIVFSEIFHNKDAYTASMLSEFGEQSPVEISRATCERTDSLLLGVSEMEFKIYEKVCLCELFMRDISRSSRGLPFQRFVQKTSSGEAIYRGNNIARYALFKSVKRVSESILEKSKQKVKFLRQPKILSQRIVAHVTQPFDHIILMSVLDRESHLTLDTVENTVLTNEDYSIAFITALMNSRFFSWYAYRFIFGKAIRTMDFDNYYIGKLPIRRIFFTTHKDEREQQVSELKSLYEGSDYDTILSSIDGLIPKDDDSNFLAFEQSITVENAIAKGYMTKQDAEKSAPKNAAVSVYDENGNPLEKSDVVQDFLAFLAEQMTDLNKDKHEQLRRFWIDLEGVTDDDTFTRLQKGKQERTLSRKEPLSPFVESESASVKHLDDALEWTEEAFKEFAKMLPGRIPNLSDLLDVYNRYSSDVRRLAQRIQATDELIDGVVYRLYGLTEEEIAVVEKEELS